MVRYPKVKKNHPTLMSLATMPANNLQSAKDTVARIKDKNKEKLT